MPDHLKRAKVRVDWEDVNQFERREDVRRCKKTLRASVHDLKSFRAVHSGRGEVSPHCIKIASYCVNGNIHLWYKSGVPGVPHLPESFICQVVIGFSSCISQDVSWLHIIGKYFLCAYSLEVITAACSRHIREPWKCFRLDSELLLQLHLKSRNWRPEDSSLKKTEHCLEDYDEYANIDDDKYGSMKGSWGGWG